MNNETEIGFQDDNSDEVIELRLFFSKCWPKIINKVMGIITSFHEALAKQKIGFIKNRIGVFGPYPGGGRETVLEVARYFSDLGFASITGDGFFMPNDPTIHDLAEISPPVITDLFQESDVPQYYYYQILPRLVHKAVFFMNDERGQTIELIGCFDARIPVHGFILHDIITNGNLDCVYLAKKEGISACTVPDHLSCLGNTLKRPWCPFYDSIDISWMTKQLFLRRKKHHLLAAKNIENLKPFLKKFATEEVTRQYLINNNE